VNYGFIHDSGEDWPEVGMGLGGRHLGMGIDTSLLPLLRNG